MKPLRNWVERRAQGHSVEAAARAHFAEVGWTVAPGPDNFSYDMLLNNGRRYFLVEIKDESKHAHTGNLCIELRQGADGMPSGISISESNVTIHYLNENAVLYRTQRMRMHLRQHRSRYSIRRFPNSDNANVGVLVPVISVRREPWCESINADQVHESRVWESIVTVREPEVA